MTESELRDSYEAQKPFLLAWGEFVKSHIVGQLIQNNENPNVLFKVPPITRVKETGSFLEKALYRDKHYQDPLNEITDRVGLRFVVLCVDEISKVGSIIQASALWIHSKDRDFEEERDAKPELFTYQSVHYIIRSNNDISCGDIVIPANTPCEIQIRTLLQHAYAELSHDIVYKSTEAIPIGLKRKFARSMALIEATDELFKEVKGMLIVEDEKFTELISALKPHTLTYEYNERLNKFLYSAYMRCTEEGRITAEILRFIEKNKYLEDRVKSADESNLLIRKQPIVYMLYYLAQKMKYQFQDLWPLTEVELEPLLNDIGISLDN